MEKHHRHSSLPQRSTTLDINLTNERELDRSDLRLPVDANVTSSIGAATTVQSIQASLRKQSSSSSQQYRSHSMTTTIISTTHDHLNINEKVDCLPSNVSSRLSVLEYYQRHQTDAFIPSFKLPTSDNTKKKEYDSSSNTYSTTTSEHFDLNYQQKYDTLQQFDKMIIDLPWNYDVSEKMDEEDTQELNSTDDPIRLQKSEQSPTSTTNNQESLMMKDMKEVITKIPDYLTKRNKLFVQMIRETLSITQIPVVNNNIEELRKITILIYKIMVIQNYHTLWKTYLKSGLGQLMTPSIDQLEYLTNISIWPKEIKTSLQLPSDTNKTKETEIYSNFVNKQLHELDYQLKQYQMELNVRANNFHNYTLTIPKMIETYIQQHLQSFHMKIEHQIKLIHYDYHIRALKLEYFRHNPSAYQEQFMKQLCQAKYQQETTEQEYHLLKHQISYYNSPSQSFECSLIAQSTLIDSIQNPDDCQELFHRHKEIAVQSRANLFHLYLKTAEEERNEYKKKYEDGIKKMWSDHQPLDRHRKMPLIMIQLIERRCEKISERIKCVYKFKAQSISLQKFN